MTKEDLLLEISKLYKEAEKVDEDVARLLSFAEDVLVKQIKQEWDNVCL